MKSYLKIMFIQKIKYTPIVKFLFLSSLVCLSFITTKAQNTSLLQDKNSIYMNLKNVNIGDVKWTKGFWADKFETVHRVGIPSMWHTLEDPNISHAFSNFLVAAGLENGEFNGWWWLDGDFYKWVEAVSSVYGVTKDEDMGRLMDKVIDVIGKAQRADGYINTSIQIGHGHLEGEKHPFVGKTKPLQSIEDHELYNMGHLMTAACIHYRATGKANFLDIAKKTGDFLYQTFSSRDPSLAHFDFNPSNIMGTVELYRATGDKKYLELAQVFVDMRGSRPGGTDWTQTRVPLREETEAVGHAVTANYLYSGATDVYAETGEKALLDALLRIWENVTYTKMYITGATGALHAGASSRGDMVRGDLVNEAYGRKYELPNSTAYNETCANIAFGMWNWRLLGVTGEEKYADVMETVFYNSALSGISIDGRNFFYTNPLRRTFGTPLLLPLDRPTRVPFMLSYCCPPNIMRTIAEMGNYAYSINDKGVWVNLYGGNTLATKLPDGSDIQFEQITNYPWEEDVKIICQEAKKKDFGLMLRIPEWAAGATVKVNGKAINESVIAGGYFELNRYWAKGDVVELHLPMKIQLIEANPFVEEVKNQVAVKRGPIVYCLESPDLPDSIKVSSVMLPDSVKFKPVYKKDLLGGVMVLQGKAFSKPTRPWTKSLYKEVKPGQMKLIDIQLIPYYAWSNRGISEMSVWLPLAYGTDF